MLNTIQSNGSHFSIPQSYTNQPFLTNPVSNHSPKCPVQPQQFLQPPPTLPMSEHQPHLQPLVTPLSLIARQTMQQKSSCFIIGKPKQKKHKALKSLWLTHVPRSSNNQEALYQKIWTHVAPQVDSGTTSRQWHQVAWRRFNQHKPESAGQTIQAQILWGRFPDNCEWLVWELHKSKLGNLLHNGSDHWLAITTIGVKQPEVIVYNSLHSTVSDNVKAQIASLLCTQECAIR